MEFFDEMQLTTEVNSNVRSLNEVEAAIERAIASAQKSEQTATIAKQARTGFFHRKEALESLQEAVSDVSKANAANTQLICTIIRYMQNLTRISNAILMLGAVSIAQNRALENKLKECLSGYDSCGTLMQATKDEIRDIIIQLKSKRDSLEEIERLKQRVETLEDINGVQHPPKLQSPKQALSLPEQNIQYLATFCGYCGKRIDGAPFCGYCGKRQS